MSYTENTYTPHIPLSSGEPLWEWNVASDDFFLSRGAREALCLSPENVPATMKDFLPHITPSCLSMFHARRNALLNGASGSLLESTYSFNGIYVWERMIVLERDIDGRALSVMGYCTVSPSHPAARFLPPKADAAIAAQDGTGYWHCSLQDGLLYLDACCAALLGYSPAIPIMKNLNEWRQRLHPGDRGTLYRHQLIFERSTLGDAFTDLIRLRLENGVYAHMIARGSVLERDFQGQALQLAGTLRSATAIRHSGNETRLERTRLLFAVNSSGDGLWDWDVTSGDIYFSPSYLAMLGHTTETLPGRIDSWRENIHPDDTEKVTAQLQPRLQSPHNGDTYECTYRLRHADGRWIWILDRGYVTHRNNRGQATHMVGMHTNITSSQSDRDRLEELVKNDPLTGLRSRTFFQAEMDRLEREGIRPVSIIFCDVNGLKLINDYLGHEEGDKLLHRAAQLLRQTLRVSDCVARTGGDEFVVLLPGCTAERAGEILGQMERHIAEVNAAGGHDDMPVLLSLGAATATSPDTALADVLGDADKRMLHTKAVHRANAHRHIKDWIERHTTATVSLEDNRCAV